MILKTLDSSSEVPLLFVSALTCDRSLSLDRLIHAFGHLEMPVSVSVVFLIVDNRINSSSQALVEKYQKHFPNLEYVVEPIPGIPFARNRAINEALERGAHALCFIDDDERPDSNWLKNLVDFWQNSGAEMVGWPVEIERTNRSAGPWKRFINLSLISRQNRKNRKTERDALKGRKFTVVTNNWLCDLRWLLTTGLRFDEKMQFSGGSDTAFFRRAREVGFKAAWCANAVVWETLEVDRLSLRYQFDRARCQSINHFRMSHSGRGAFLVARTIAIAGLRTISGALLLFFPVLGLASLTVGVRSLGWATGRLQAISGRESRLYG